MKANQIDFPRILRALFAAVLLGSVVTARGTAGEALALPEAAADTVWVRVNQVGYLPDDAKVAIAFAERPVDGSFTLVDAASDAPVFEGPLRRSEADGWGTFSHFYELDFSDVRAAGRYYVRVDATGDTSPDFAIGDDAYKNYQEDLVGFMRQQRCGYNPFLDMVCHQRDGRTAYGPMPDSTFVTVTGGWHDAGDQLKYLLTGSNATARMMLAYELEPSKFGDQANELGQPRPNGLPDVLDEARWGLDWLHKMHPAADELFHQVADDRDHIGWKWPDQDSSDYGWGPESYRVAYFADGEPQGRGRYQSEATGVANLAGRVAAAMAMGYRVWKNVDPEYAAQSLDKARSAYAMGKAREGYQQGNSYGSRYRYTEDTWADDMEWGAAELYRVTGEEQYLEDAKRYARMAGTTSWMPLDTADHYQFYPFINVGHYALYSLVDDAFKDTLAAYYRDGIEHTIDRGSENPYKVGVPFIWCSNNLLTALVTQILLYERMTGDMQYHDFMVAQRDWLFGRNPWGTSMFMNIPRDGEYPEDVHTSVYALTGEEVPGGLIDGPLYRSTWEFFNGMGVLDVSEPDEFARFQNDYVVYHDDIADFATNEPTMDGTAGAIYMMAHFGADVPATSSGSQ